MRKTGMMLAGVWSFCVFCVQAPWILRGLLCLVHSMREELQQVGELVSEHERELDAGVRVQLEKMGSVKLRLSEHTEALDEIKRQQVWLTGRVKDSSRIYGEQLQALHEVKRQQVEMSKVLEHCAKNAADADLVDTVEKLKLTATDLYSRIDTLDKWSTEKLQRLDAGFVGYAASISSVEELKNRIETGLQEVRLSAAKSGAHLPEHISE